MQPRGTLEDAIDWKLASVKTCDMLVDVFGDGRSASSFNRSGGLLTLRSRSKWFLYIYKAPGKGTYILSLRLRALGRRVLLYCS